MKYMRFNPFIIGIIFCCILLLSCQQPPGAETASNTDSKSLVVSTWPNKVANEEAFSVLNNGGSAIDAVEAGVRKKELDVEDSSVGIGGLPDAKGRVTLDASIMDHMGNAGSVTYLQNILHPISIARLVMDSTPHVMLSGDGAYEFALQHGYEKVELLTDSARARWQQWVKNHEAADNHDTIGLLARDENGDLSGGCSTSGMAFKLPGRVGDSPIIGAGLYVDNAVGAATATGVGEEVIKIVGSFLIVELMRNGQNPQQACENAVRRIVERSPGADVQVGFVAMDKMGNVGAYAIQQGFEYTVTRDGESLVLKADSYND